MSAIGEEEEEDVSGTSSAHKPDFSVSQVFPHSPAGPHGMYVQGIRNIWEGSLSADTGWADGKLR